jgi:predicted ATPase
MPDASAWPVLVDFGLAAQFSSELSREALEIGLSAAGTAAYMAPEQIRGELVDARADLYSLGCILYELLTGRPPFCGGSLARLLAAHLAAAPVPPSELVDGVPPELDRLVLQLLAKQPRERLGHALDVAAALERLGAADGQAGGPEPRAYLYRPGFAGRQELLQRFEQEFTRLKSGAGALVLIGAESGAGKTRLLLEMAREAERLKLAVLSGECAAVGAGGGGGSPLHPLRRTLQAIGDRCREQGLAETERLLGPRGRLLALYEPSLAGLPGQDAYPEDVAAQRAAPLPAEDARRRLFLYLAETLEAFCEQRPLVLLLDDLQWSDELTLGFVEHLLTMEWLHALPLFVAGAYRTEEIGATGSPALRTLLDSAGEACVVLERLDERAIGSMASDMLAVWPPPALFVRFLAEQSEGNPFFVAEYLRTAVAEGLLYRDELGRWQMRAPAAVAATEQVYRALPLPGSIRELVSRRLERLSPQGMHLAQLASVLGREVEEVVLLELAHKTDAEALESVDELLARQVLEESAPGNLRFVHDKICEVTYERIDEAQRPALHRTAAEGIERRYGKELDEHLAALGQHWERAGRTERARECYLGAARNAVKRYGHQEAEQLYRAYLRLVEAPTVESIAARNDLGEKVLRVQGRMDEALDEHRSALELARQIADRWSEATCLRCMGSVHQQQDRPEQARELYEQALELFRQAGDRQTEGLVLGNLADLHENQGRLEEARELYEQALDLLRRTGDRQSEGRVLANLALLHDFQGRPQEAQALYEQAVQILGQTGDQQGEGHVCGNLASLHQDQGRPEEARKLFERALDLLRQAGNRRGEAVVLGNLGLLHAEQDRSEEARKLYEHALALHRQIGNRRSEGMVLGNLALLCAEQGRLDEAQELYEQARDLHCQVDNRRGQGIALGSLSNLKRLMTGRLEEADALAREAERLFEAAGYRFELGELLCWRGHIALAGGQSARELLERARALAAEASAGGDSKLGKALARLQRAQEAFEAGRPLFRGECPEDIAEGLRRRLSESCSG